jgi:hypothetical protein
MNWMGAGFALGLANGELCVHGMALRCKICTNDAVKINELRCLQKRERIEWFCITETVNLQISAQMFQGEQGIEVKS